MENCILGQGGIIIMYEIIIKIKLVLNPVINGKENKENKRKGKGKGKGKGKRTEKDENILQHPEQSTQNDVLCVLYGEPYMEPPTEDWVQCPECCDWTHELCSDIENGCLLCVNCKM